MANLQIGDRIRFLNTIGGGKVKGFQNKHIAIVEDETGFDVPVMVSECVVVEPASSNNKNQKNNSKEYKIENPPIDLEFTKLNIPGTGPLPRWRHTATLFENTQILIFGGFHTTDHRLNDVWVFDTISNTWQQPNPKHNWDGRHNTIWQD